MVWSLNVVISLPLRLSKPFRKKTLWVFGCWEGIRYDDNSRYLYEYIKEAHKEIECVWISRNPEIVSKLQKEGTKAYLASSLSGITCMLRAGATFYTNGLDDLSDVCWLYGSEIVCLNHGNTGIKKAGYTLDKFSNKGIKVRLKRVRDSLFNYYKYDKCACTSNTSCKLFRELYGDPNPKKYMISGMPRNDLLEHPDLFNVSKPSFLNDEYRYIVYLPTYREYKNNVIKEFVDNIINDEELKAFMEQHKICLLVKPHNIDFTSAAVDLKSNIVKFVSSDDVESTHVLMSFSDFLITDYSSCGTDFALTGKPVVFYTPDFEEYRQDNGFREMWLNFYNKHPEFRSFEHVKHEIMTYFVNGVFDHSPVDWLNSVYLSPKIKGTLYSENVYRIISREVGLFNEKK